MSGARRPRVAVVVFPGSNCDRDAMAAVEVAGGEAVPASRIPAGTDIGTQRFPSFLPDGERFLTGAQSVKVTLAGPVDRLNAIDPEEVSVLVHVPDGWNGNAGEARRGRGEGLRYEVVQPAGEVVSVVGVTPERIPVERR